MLSKDSLVKIFGLTLAFLGIFAFFWALAWVALALPKSETVLPKHTVITPYGSYEDLRFYTYYGDKVIYKDDQNLKYTFSGNYTAIEQSNEN